jgi:transposase InsO family protein
MFKWYVARVEKETGKILKCLRSDRGGDFTSNDFNLCNDRGIKRQTSTPRIPPQNGIVERRNIFVMDCARTLMMEKNVALKYWREVVIIAVYTLNHV